MHKELNTYSSILKSTFLFGFVQVFNILTKVGIYKAVAIFLGPGGMGIISLYQSTINILRTGFDFGISQSAVRDISQKMSSSDEDYSRTIVITKRIILLTALLGGLVTIVLSPLLSKWTFNNSDYTYSFMYLSVVVVLSIITEGQLGILKGARRLKALAKASLYGSIVGLVTGVPFYWFLGENGIIPSLIFAAIAAFIFSHYFVGKINYIRSQVSTKKAFHEGEQMIKMGIALMYVSFLGFVSEYIIRAYISSVASINTVGLFQAGTMVVSSYFGIVITALTTDYYPRISAICNNNKQIEIELNKQSQVGLILIAPLVVFFMFAQRLFISILYTESFIPTIEYLEYATFGVLVLICSNALGMILLAKQDSKVFFVTATIGRIVIISISLFFFHIWGLKGLGVASVLTAIFHLLFMQGVIWVKYKIRMSWKLCSMLLITISFAIAGFFFKDISNPLMRYILGCLLMIVALWYAYFQMKFTMEIDIIQFVRNKFKR